MAYQNNDGNAKLPSCLHIFSLICLIVLLSFSTLSQASSLCTHLFGARDFQSFVRQIRAQAKNKGISQKTINMYLTGLHAPRKRAYYDLHHQPQKRLTFATYYRHLVPKDSADKGGDYLRKYHKLLARVQAKYHVQPQYILALWGIETYYGKHLGHTPIVATLVTMSYQHHRTKFYKAQLFAALQILDKDYHIPQQKQSTFDGGMGQTQFEPTVYLQDAVDFDHHGFSNIWTSKADIFASIANYLHKRGWNGNQGWGLKVKVPPELAKRLSLHEIKKSVRQWQALGVKTMSGKPLPKHKFKVAVIMPEGPKGPAFMIYPNFDVLLKWNNTSFEALSVGLLADAIHTS